MFNIFFIATNMNIVWMNKLAGETIYLLKSSSSTTFNSVNVISSFKWLQVVSQGVRVEFYVSYEDGENQRYLFSIICQNLAY